MQVGILLSGFAAIFAYLSWVRMTTKRRTDTQQTLSNHFEGLDFRTGEYRGEIQKVTVTADADILQKLRNNVLPGGIYGNKTKLWINLQQGFPDTTHMVRTNPQPEYSVSSIEAHNPTMIVEFDTVNENEIWDLIEDIDKLFDEIIIEIGDS